MSQNTLEQRRAKDAWEKCEGCGKEYVNLAKSLPALMMNSGLMQTMAFLNEKGQKDRQCHGKLAEHLRHWLSDQFDGVPSDFEGFMEHLMDACPRRFQEITVEAFGWLRWMRQMAAARHRGG